jgi:glycosyltransferase involved in cell wall biosynthesis
MAMATKPSDIKDSPKSLDHELHVGCLFLHTLHGSLGSFTRVRELSMSAAQNGIRTSILTPYEHHQVLSDGVQIQPIPNLALNMGLGHQMYNLSRRIYYNNSLSRFFNGSTRGKLMNALSEKLEKILKTSGMDVLQAEQDFAIVVGKKVKRQTGIPLIADIHNITAEELVAARIITKDGKEYNELQHETAENLSYADVVIAVSDLLKEYIISEYNISHSKVLVVPPGGRPRIRNVVKHPPNHFVYSGLLSYRENVELFVKSMPHILRRFSDAKFFITRKGETLNLLSRLARNLNVEPKFFWYDNVNDLYDFLLSCYAGILPSSNDLARRMGTPAKLFDYLSLGLPVVANDIGGWTDIIETNRVGVVTGSEPTEFAEGIFKISDSREEYAENALRLVRDRYNWDNSAQILLGAYNKVTH